MLPVVLPLPLPCEGFHSSFHRSALGLLGLPYPSSLSASREPCADFCFGSLQPLALVSLAFARRYFFRAAFFLPAFFLAAFFLAAGAFFLATFFFAVFFDDIAATFFFAAFFFAFAMFEAPLQHLVNDK